LALRASGSTVSVDEAKVMAACRQISGSLSRSFASRLSQMESSPSPSEV
jgi:hypothetical protein